MTVPVVTFFNNKGGVGKTSLVYHVASMLADLGRRVLVADLDPQANLTAAFLDEDRIAELWDGDARRNDDTIYRCVQPLAEAGDLRDPHVCTVAERLSLLPGDLALSGFEELLSREWPLCLDSGNLYRPFRVTTAFWTVLQAAAKHCDLVVVDVGPSLGAINRAALIATDFVVVPLGADLFSLQGLRNLGPTLRGWRDEWHKRRSNWPEPKFLLPMGHMKPIGYVVQQYSVRAQRPVAAYDRWVRRMPGEYARSVLGDPTAPDRSVDDDPQRIATVKHFRSLVPLAQDARKPIFKLTAADGAIGSHAQAARAAHADFAAMAQEILRRMTTSAT